MALTWTLLRHQKHTRVHVRPLQRLLTAGRPGRRGGRVGEESPERTPTVSDLDQRGQRRDSDLGPVGSMGLSLLSGNQLLSI